MSHALVIGGTGMLKGASLHLLNKFDKVSVIGRSSDGFKQLQHKAGKRSPKLNKLQLDYTDYNVLTALLIKSINDFGEINLAVSWIHSTAPLAPVFIAKVINDTSAQCDLYEVLSSAHADPRSANESSGEKFAQFKNIIYHKVILGFVIGDNGSRWLTDDEITNGISTAVEKNLTEHIIGTVEPWSERP